MQTDCASTCSSFDETAILPHLLSSILEGSDARTAQARGSSPARSENMASDLDEVFGEEEQSEQLVGEANLQKLQDIHYTVRNLYYACVFYPQSFVCKAY